MTPLFTERSDWKGKTYINEIFPYSEERDLSPVTQVRAVCFSPEGKIVLYRHIDGWIGLPGGTVETGENLNQSLEREILEETACKLISFKPFAYVRSYEVSAPESITHNLRYAAKVDILDQPVEDPAGKALERILVSPDEAVKALNWGEKGRLLISLAQETKPYL